MRTETRSATASATPTASESSTPTATPTLTSTPAGTPTDTPRPNFLIIELDDTRFDGLDRMPAVQSRLLPASMRFTNSFVPLASCCSSRASLLSGLYAFHHGTRQVSGPIGGAKTFRKSEYDQRTIAVWLHDAGYATGLFGKYLNEYEGEQDKGPNGTYYIPPGWTRWRAFVSEHYGGIHGPSYELVDESGTRTTYDDHSSDLQYSTDVTGALVRQFIGEQASARRPFFAIWAPYASHGDTPGLAPIPADKYTLTFDDIPVFRPPNWDEQDRGDKNRFAQHLPATLILAAITDFMRGSAYETLLSADDQIRLMLDDLDALGIADHTVVLLTSDNGVTWGEHALYAQTKACPYEECIRVPFMVRYPARVMPGDAVTPALNIDIAPTVAELAGIDIPAAAVGLHDPDGQSLVPALDGVPGWFRDDFLLEQWRAPRNATITYSAQPVDGDRLRLFYGPAFPRASAMFEFDSGDGVAEGAHAVPIGTDADTTYHSLGMAVAAAVPHVVAQRDTVHKQLNILDTDPAAIGFYWWEEVNQAAAFHAPYPLADFFGIRDVLNGYTYVLYETGETELYDVHPNADPWELQSVALDPAYAEVRARLDARMHELAELP
jgi:arylsulfatase A-like enzyme